MRLFRLPKTAHLLIIFRCKILQKFFSKTRFLTSTQWISCIFRFCNGKISKKDAPFSLERFFKTSNFDKFSTSQNFQKKRCAVFAEKIFHFFDKKSWFLWKILICVKKKLSAKIYQKMRRFRECEKGASFSPWKSIFTCETVKIVPGSPPQRESLSKARKQRIFFSAKTAHLWVPKTAHLLCAGKMR